MVGDSAILDYLRANDPGCTLRAHGEDLVPDTFSLAMPKGFSLRVKLNALLARYQSSGHLDHLKHKWYGDLPCFRISADFYKPQALDISTVAGVFLALTLGIGVGLVILILEHLVYRYILPNLRTKPKDSIWRNRNLMFVSQKLYRFINCVELVSPHHSAKELVNNIRTGQIMGLFQKSVKRKENEQRRRRKSKAQFFEMIQEIRRVQKAEKEDGDLSDVEQPSSAAKETPRTTLALPGSKDAADTSHTPSSSSATGSSKQRPPSSLTSTHKPSNTQATIAIDYIPGSNPHEDTDGIIRVNSTQPLGNVSFDTATLYSQPSNAEREDDSESGILILRVKEDEEAASERNCLTQRLEDLQPYSPTSESIDNCDRCSYPSQDDGTSVHSKNSGGCLNCLQRQDSRKQEKKSNGSTYYPCNASYGTRETLLREQRAATLDGSMRVPCQRQTDQNPHLTHAMSQSIPSCKSSASLKSFPGYTSRQKQTATAVWSSKSLDQMDHREDTIPDQIYEGVRLVPLSHQAAMQSSGSLQLVAALSPGCERVNADHLRHVSKADLWRLWQDSEIQLRARLRQAESQRDELIRRLCHITSRDSLGNIPDCTAVPEEPRAVREKVVAGKFGSLDALLEVRDIDFSKQTIIPPPLSSEMIVCKEQIRTAEYRVSNDNWMPRVKKTIKNTSEVSFRNIGEHVRQPTASVRRQRMRSEGQHDRRISFEPPLPFREEVFHERLSPPPSFEDKKPSRGNSHSCRREDSHGSRREDSFGSRREDSRSSRREDSFGSRREDSYGSRREDSHGSHGSRRESEEELTPRRRSQSRKHNQPTVMESSVDFPHAGYPHTPLPLLHSLHQQTKHESTKQSSLRHRKPTHRKEELSGHDDYSDPLRAPPPMFGGHSNTRANFGDHSGSSEECPSHQPPVPGQTPRRYYHRDRNTHHARPPTESRGKRLAFKHSRHSGGRRPPDRGRIVYPSGGYRNQGTKKRTSYDHSSSSEENIHTS